MDTCISQRDILKPPMDSAKPLILSCSRHSPVDATRYCRECSVLHIIPIHLVHTAPGIKISAATQIAGCMGLAWAIRP